MTSQDLRLIYVGNNIELRIISLLVRAKEIAQDVVFVDTGSTDRTKEFAEEFGCNVIQYAGDDQTASSMASFLSNSTLSDDFSNLIIYVTDEWKLRELPVVVNRSREGWDIYISYNNELGTQDLISEDLVIGSLDIDHLFLSKRGLNELAKSNSMTSTSNFPSELRVRVIESSDKIKLPQRESLATQDLLSYFIGCWKLSIHCFCSASLVLFYSFWVIDYLVMLLIPLMN